MILEKQTIAKTAGCFNKEDERYLWRREEVGRGCWEEGKSIGKKQFREMMINWVRGRGSRCNVPLFLLGAGMDHPFLWILLLKV